LLITYFDIYCIKLKNNNMNNQKSKAAKAGKAFKKLEKAILILFPVYFISRFLIGIIFNI